MHINLDSNEKIKGYYDSPWPNIYLRKLEQMVNGM